MSHMVKQLNGPRRVKLSMLKRPQREFQLGHKLHQDQVAQPHIYKMLWVSNRFLVGCHRPTEFQFNEMDKQKKKSK